MAGARIKHSSKRDAKQLTALVTLTFVVEMAQTDYTTPRNGHLKDESLTCTVKERRLANYTVRTLVTVLYTTCKW